MRDRSLPDRFRWIIPALIVVLAVLVRLLHDAGMARTPFFRHPGLDAAWHDQWARQIVAGTASSAAFFRAPGYAWFLALVYRLAGSGAWPIHVVQALLGGLTVWLVYRLARRLYGRTAGWIASAIAALYGPLIYFDGELLAPALAIPLFLLALHLTLRARTVRGWALAGIAYGAGAVVLPNILAVVVLVGLAIALARVTRVARPGAAGESAPPSFLRGAVPLGLGVAVVLAPVILRNGLAAGDWGLASQGGVNLYAGNNPQATGVSVVLPQFPRQPGWQEFVAKTEAWASEQAGRPLRPSEVSNYYTRQALRFWMTSPGPALRLFAAKTYYLFNGHEIPNNRDLYRDRRDSAVMALLLWHLGTFHFPLGLLWPLAVLGLALRPPGRAWPLVLFVAGYGLSVVLFFVTERYRLPLIPVLIVFAAGAIVNLARGRRPGPIAIAAVALAALAANSHLGLAGQSNPAQEKMRLGEAWLEAGDFRKSAEAFEAATRLDPRSADAFGCLGAAWQSAGDPARALRAYQSAADRGSLEPVMWFNRAALLLEAGRVGDAADNLEKAVSLDPKYVEAWVNLGLARSAQGETGPALEALDHALALAPANATALQEKGLLLARRGDISSAMKAWQAAVAAAPGAVEPRLNLAVLEYEQGRLIQAEQILNQVVMLHPEVAAAHFHLARIAARTGRRAMMVDELKKAIAGGFGPIGPALKDPAFAACAADPEIQQLAQRPGTLAQ